jgi:hypothetical protein
VEYIPLLGIFFVRVPVIIIWLVGIGVAIWKSKKNPPVSLLACIALLMLLLEAPGGGFLSHVLPLMMRGQPEIGPLPMAYLVTAIGIIQGLLEAIAWGLLIVAVFGRRAREWKVESAS